MRIQAGQSIILAIDLQDRLLGTLPPARRTPLLHNITRLLEAATALGLPALATAQYPQGLGPVREEIRSHAADLLEKTAFSCLRSSNSRQWLEAQDGRRQVILAGIELHICVLQTALDLQAEGWQPVVVADACASRDAEQQQPALERLRQAGVTVAVAESVFYEWLGDAAHPAFRTLAAAWR
jgi:nicotinamidase-related amidase